MVSVVGAIERAGEDEEDRGEREEEGEAVLREDEVREGGILEGGLTFADRAEISARTEADEVQQIAGERSPQRREREPDDARGCEDEAADGGRIQIHLQLSTLPQAGEPREEDGAHGDTQREDDLCE